MTHCTVFNEGEIKYSMDFMADFKNLDAFMGRKLGFDKNLMQYGHI